MTVIERHPKSDAPYKEGGKRLIDENLRRYLWAGLDYERYEVIKIIPGKLVNTIFEKELPYFKAALLLHKSAILFAHSISFFPLISAIRVAKTKLTVSA